MKKIVLLGFMCLCLLSCNNDDKTNDPQLSDIVGTWKLIEYYADPGDGNVNFIPIESDKIIVFNSDGTLSSNANLCQVFAEIGQASNGTYSELDLAYTILSCPNQPYNGSYQVVDSKLIIEYLCIEACQEKYVKIE
ncbi:hypothetical protein [Psychroserpens sp. MEBiC05023]